MDGGTLDVKDWGIHFDDGHLFSYVVSGGYIKMNGGFSSDRHDFAPTGGTLELYGANDSVIDLGWGNELYNVNINKSVSRNISKNNETIITTKLSKRGKRKKVLSNSRSDLIELSDDLIISNDLNITSGILDLTGHNLQIGNDLNIFGSLKNCISTLSPSIYVKMNPACFRIKIRNF